MSSDSRPDRYQFLDGIRFLCATWVAISHLGAPRLDLVLSFVTSQKYAELLLKSFGYLFCGVAAVMAFFIISGFCIHLPYAGSKPMNVRAFYLARIPRVALPMLAAMTVASVIPGGLEHLKPVLWSLYCEMGYYLAYPLLLIALRRYGTIPLVAVAFVPAAIVAFIPDSSSGNFWAPGIVGTTILGLPIWLLGCRIAAIVFARQSVAFVTGDGVRWILRISTLCLGAAALLLHFHSPIKYKYSMLIFSVPCYLWILSEFMSPGGKELYESLSKLGKATFSIYLMHMLAPPLELTLGVDLKGALEWPVTMAFVVLLSSTFYLLIERPSHRLSRRLGAWGGSRNTPVAVKSAA